MNSQTLIEIEKRFQAATAAKHIHEAVLLAESADGSFSHSWSYGGKEADTPFVAASITKLFTSAVVYVLLDQGKLSLDHKLSRYFASSDLKGLHVYQQTDYSQDITLSQLLSQNSGLPDIYEETRSPLKQRVIREDFRLSFGEKLALTKELKPHFAPGSRNRAHYNNINFDLLGEIIEKVSGLPLNQAYRSFIFQPLGMERTFLRAEGDEPSVHVYYKDQALHRPDYLRSSGPSGGCISTARELVQFLRGFFGGGLFSREHVLPAAAPILYRKTQFSLGPVRYGPGYMQIPLGGPAMLFQGKGELLGHSGSTGSFAFYDPLKQRFWAGDFNQMAAPSLPVRFVIQLAVSAKP